MEVSALHGRAKDYTENDLILNKKQTS